jgi:multidrug efflux pump subunit AcrA (membrane-fusion protein)
MADRLKCLALSTALGLSIAAPARAQSVEELKAMVLKLQQRVEQLEANQRVVPQKARPTPPRPAPVAQGPSPAQLKAAQQAAEQAQKSAAEAQQAAAQAQQEAAQAKDSAAAEVKAAYAPPPGKPGGSFRIPGTETVMRAYGFMKLNGSDDLTTFNPNDALSAQSIPLFGTAAQRQGGGSQMSARRSRFDLETWTPVNDTYGDFHTL